MNQDNQGSILTRESFRFEEYVDVMAGLGGRVLITDTKQGVWTADTVTLGDLTLQRVHEGCSSVFEGESAEGMVSFFVRISHSPEVQAYGYPWDLDTLVILRPGAAASGIVNGPFSYYIITLPIARLVSALENHDPAQRERLLTGRRVVDITPDSRLRIMALARDILNAAGSGALDHPRSRRTAAEDLLGALLEAHASRTLATADQGRPRISRTRLLKQIHAYIRQPVERDLSVPEMAARLGVAERTLRNVFREHFDMSPKAFLQTLQLHEIRDDLLRAEPGETVTAVAANHGIWSYGRFAQRYRKVFGESPSQTLTGS